MKIPAQQEFDDTYITSTEIGDILKISRASICAARARNLLPPCITLPGANISLWKRKEVENILVLWKDKIVTRRNNDKQK